MEKRWRYTMMTNRTTIIFDLDGTLIESSVGILEGFRLALRECNIEAKLPIEKSLIGPPLKQTISKLIDSMDTAMVDVIADAFKANYDSVGYLKTVLFSGVIEMLEELAQEYTLYIATNKRIIPTLKIMKHLKIDSYFNGIYALDSFEPSLSSKGELIGQIMSDHGIPRELVCYVGDRIEDGVAAGENEIPFIMAAWGFDVNANSMKINNSWSIAREPNDIVINSREKLCAK
jgi:phosphoglycolate phosphatase